MSKNLVYANADEFHVKSTLVYATGDDVEELYYDEEATKQVYADELKRLFFAGGLKICYPMPIIESGTTQTVFLSPIGFNEFNGVASVVCLANLDNALTFSAPARSVFSDNALFPAEEAVEGH